METIQCPWKPIRLIWIWDWGLLLSSFALYDLLRPSSPLPNQFNLSLLIPPRCSPSLSFLSPSLSVVHYHALSHQSRFLSMTDGLCECSSKSSVRSSAHVVKAERRAVHSGTCVALWGGDCGSQEGVWVCGCLASFLSVPGSSFGRPCSDHISHGKATLVLLFFFQDLFFCSHPISFPHALFQQSLWFSHKPDALRASPSLSTS